MNKSALLAVKCPEDDVEVPLMGDDGNLTMGSVHVRGLTREEWFAVGKVTGENPDPDAIRRGEAFSLSKGLLDPELTMDEAKEWLAGSPNVITSVVVNRIMELTGARGGAAREAYKSL